ncbi:hypothetical protein [Streptomyces sp. SD15]
MTGPDPADKDRRDPDQCPGGAAPHRLAGADRLLQRDERARLYRIDRALVEGLARAFAIADARPDLLRR